MVPNASGSAVKDLVLVMILAIGTASAALAETLHVPDEYATIQEAIDAAVAGDEVVVADGTYTGPGYRDLDFTGKAITVRSENGPDSCTIDLQASEMDPHRAFHFHSGETAASVVEGLTIQNGFMNRGGAVLCEDDSSPLLQSCVFQQNSVSQAIAEDGGGAVYTLDSSPAFIDCQFSQNHHVEVSFPFAGGGAVQIQAGGNPTFIACTFSENTAFGPDVSDGGAVFVGGGSHPDFHSCTFTANQADWDAAVVALSGVTMYDCRFEGNSTTGGGGGAYGQYGAPYGAGNSALVNCSFIGNSALGNAGGAVIVQFSDTGLAFRNCLFADNHTNNRGGGLWVGDEAEATVTNCTFSGNTALLQGGALRVFNLAIANVDNSILWDNAPDQVAVLDAVVSVFYSDIQGGWIGEGNIDADPLYVDAPGGDWHLAAGSPCIDAGDNTGLVPFGCGDCDTPQETPGCSNTECETIVCDIDPFCCDTQWDSNCVDEAIALCGCGVVVEEITTDLDGALRSQNDLDTVDTGNGTCPIVDMGSYEFATTCPADIDCDADVGVTDLLELIERWGPCPGWAADIDGDGDVDITDLLMLLAAWGPCL